MNNEEVVFDQADVDKNKIVGIIMAATLITFFLPLCSQEMQQSAYLKFRMNQCFIVLVIGIIIGIGAKILSVIPFIGSILAWAVGLIFVAFYVVDLIYACQGSGKRVPIIGGVEVIK